LTLTLTLKPQGRPGSRGRPSGESRRGLHGGVTWGTGRRGCEGSRGPLAFLKLTLILTLGGGV